MDVPGSQVMLERDLRKVKHWPGVGEYPGPIALAQIVIWQPNQAASADRQPTRQKRQRSRKSRRLADHARRLLLCDEYKLVP